MKKTCIYLVVFFFGWLLTGFNSFAHQSQTTIEKYQCPMKCEGEKTYDQPGKCPVCGMALKKIVVESGVYQCPMKCEGEKTYDKPGKCPVCGMALKKIVVEPGVYQCPMKCEGEKTYDKPGKCPVCGMALKKIVVEPGVYQCPMKCEGEKTYDKPGKCPVCGMALKKIVVEPGVYQCPMKCEGEKTYDKPGKCPVCGMSLKKTSKPAAKRSNVKISGAMMNVMQKGELGATISLDSLSNKTHLYGLGPVEYLRGELMLVDGHSYRSTAGSQKKVTVDETFQVKAPFFVYAQVDKWTETALPDSVQTLPQLEAFLDQSTKKHTRPFAFRLTASFDKAGLHVVNLPPGTAVHSPEDTRKDALNLTLKKEDAELLGFFSTEHKGVFTHHDSNVHLHILTADKKKMGHLDSMLIKKGTGKLYIGE